MTTIQVLKMAFATAIAVFFHRAKRSLEGWAKAFVAASHAIGEGVQNFALFRHPEAGAEFIGHRGKFRLYLRQRQSRQAGQIGYRGFPPCRFKAAKQLPPDEFLIIVIHFLVFLPCHYSVLFTDKKLLGFSLYKSFERLNARARP